MFSAVSLYLDRNQVVGEKAEENQYSPREDHGTLTDENTLKDHGYQHSSKRALVFHM